MALRVHVHRTQSHLEKMTAFTTEEIDAACALALAQIRARAQTSNADPAFGKLIAERMLPFGGGTEIAFRLGFGAGALWGVKKLSEELKK